MVTFLLSNPGKACIFPQMHAFPGFESFVSTLRESKRHRSTCYAGEPQQTDIEQPWQTKQLMIINYYWLLD